MSAAALFQVDAAPAHTQEAAPMGEAAALICRVVDALLREDHLGIQSAGRLVHEPNNDRRAWPWWTAPLPGERVLRLPVRPDGFLAEHRLAEPFVLVEDATGSVAAAETIDVILAVLAPLNDAEAEPGDGQCLHPGRCRRRQGPGTAGKFASNPL